MWDVVGFLKIDPKPLEKITVRASPLINVCFAPAQGMYYKKLFYLK